MRQLAKGKGKQFVGPRSLCMCGHTGDGIDSEHSTLIGSTEDGTGDCLVNGCDCVRFTWKQFTKKFENFLEGGKGVR